MGRWRRKGRRYIGVVLSGFGILDPMAKNYRALRPLGQPAAAIFNGEEGCIVVLRPATPLHVGFLIVRSWTFPQRRTMVETKGRVPGSGTGNTISVTSVWGMDLCLCVFACANGAVDGYRRRVWKYLEMQRLGSRWVTLPLIIDSKRTRINRFFCPCGDPRAGESGAELLGGSGKRVARGKQRGLPSDAIADSKSVFESARRWSGVESAWQAIESITYSECRPRDWVTSKREKESKDQMR